jgi:hypothetical protein
MEIPYRYEIMPHILAVLVDGEARSPDDIRDCVGDRFGLSEEERTMLRPGSRSKIPWFSNENAWALVYLQNPSFSHMPDELIVMVGSPAGDEGYKITEEGVAAYRDGVIFAPRVSRIRRRGSTAVRRGNPVGPLTQHAASPSMAAAPDAAPVDPSYGDAFVSLTKLAELRDAGVISDADFERKKAELLDRI